MDSVCNDPVQACPCRIPCSARVEVSIARSMEACSRRGRARHARDGRAPSPSDEERVRPVAAGCDIGGGQHRGGLRAHDSCAISAASTHRDGLSGGGDRKSTRLNSSHLGISYAVFCLKKKKKIYKPLPTSNSKTEIERVISCSMNTVSTLR